MESDLTELSSLLEKYQLRKYQLRKEDCDKQVSDRHVEEISHTCCRKWRLLLPHLQLESTVKDYIDREPKSEEEKLMTFFTTWKQKKGSRATYRKLIHALLKVDCRHDAKKVCKLFQKSLLAQPSKRRRPSQPASDKVNLRGKRLCQTSLESGEAIALPSIPEKLPTSSMLEQIITACTSGNIGEVNSLVKSGTPINTEYEGRLPIITASTRGHTEIVKFLLDHGAQVDLQGKGRWSALLGTSSKGHTETVKLLLDHGAQVDLQGMHGWSALLGASLKGHTKLLLDHGAQVDLQHIYGWSAIMVASTQGHTDTVKLLLDYSPQVDIQDKQGWSAIIMASEQGHTDIVKLLLDHGALKAKHKVSPLTMASYKGYTEIVRILIDYGCQIEPFAIEVARQQNNKAVLGLLLRNQKKTVDSASLCQDGATTSKESADMQEMMINDIDWIKKTIGELMTLKRLENSSQTSDSLKLSNLLRELLPVAAEWETIGTLLEVPEGLLSAIKRDNPNSVRDCLREMLKEWLKMIHPPSTWERLVDTVKLIDQRKAEEICIKYCTP